MDLIDIYLRAIAAQLPKSQSADIVAELREMILSQVEAREAGLGRSLTEGEIEAELHGVGHPLEVAARYRHGPRQLIGPTLFPYYVFALRAAVTLQLAISAVVFVVALLVGQGDVGTALGIAFRSAFNGVLILVGLATIAATIIEHYQIRLGVLQSWRVRNLAVLELVTWAPMRWVDEGVGWAARAANSPRAARKRSAHRVNPLALIAGGVVLTLWWVGGLHFFSGAALHEPKLVAVLGAFAHVDWPALKSILYVPVLLFGLGQIGLGALIIARPRGRRLHALGRLTLATLALATWLMAWFSSPLTPAIDIASADDLLRVLSEMWRPGERPIAEAIIALVFPAAVLGAISQVLALLWQVIEPARPLTAGALDDRVPNGRPTMDAPEQDRYRPVHGHWRIRFGYRRPERPPRAGPAPPGGRLRLSRRPSHDALWRSFRGGDRRPCPGWLRAAVRGRVRPHRPGLQHRGRGGAPPPAADLAPWLPVRPWPAGQCPGDYRADYRSGHRPALGA